MNRRPVAHRTVHDVVLDLSQATDRLQQMRSASDAIVRELEARWAVNRLRRASTGKY